MSFRVKLKDISFATTVILQGTDIKDIETMEVIINGKSLYYYNARPGRQGNELELFVTTGTLTKDLNL